MKILFIIIPVILIIIKLLTSKPDIDGVRARELMKNGCRIIDVRSQSEYRKGHIKNSINIPLNDILVDIGKHEIKKDTCVILYCASGARSESAKRFLKNEGYSNIYNGGSLRHMMRLEG